MLHTFLEGTAYDTQLQQTKLDYLLSSDRALGVLAENYVDLQF